MQRHTFIFSAALALHTALAVASPAPNVVTDWAGIVQQAIHNPPAAPRSAGTSQILHATVMLAVYDAAVAIEGRYRPFATSIRRLPYADVRAAVATAAHRTARARIAPSQVAWLDQQYASYVASIPAGIGRDEGVRVGEEAARGVLAARADDRFDVVVAYACSSPTPTIGEFVPDTGCPASPSSAQPVDAKLGGIRPFALADLGAYFPRGPVALTSQAYADDFNETRELGAVDSARRTPSQTDAAYFWSENPYVHWNRNLIALALEHRLGVIDTARLFAMTHTAVADAIIVGFAAKYHYRSWRPRTAIPLAADDGNPATDMDPGWRPLLAVNHPEYPSGHGFWSGALTSALASFFRMPYVTWTISTSRAAVPQIVRTERTYEDLRTLMTEIGMARIWGGLHWRQAIVDGEAIGRRVADAVLQQHFQPDEP